MVVCDNIFYHMTIDLKTVKHISKLARISLDEKKAEKLATDMNSIFEFIEKLNELNTDNVEPLTSIAIEVNGSTLSVFNSFNFSINSNIEFISVASFSAFFSSSEILANFDMCFTVLRSIVIW